MAHVHLLEGFPRDAVAEGDPMVWLAAQLGDGSQVTVGSDPPPETTILVGGRAPDQDLPALQAIVVPWAGLPAGVTEYAQRRPDVSVYNLHHNAAATTEMAVGLLLACARGIPRADAALREGRWLGRQEEVQSFLLSGKTATILGYGSIGRKVGEVLRALGMRTLGVRRSKPEGEPDVMGIGQLRQALEESHALVCTAPGTAETESLIGEEEISLLKPPRLIVNVGRGKVIQEEALYRACRDGVVSAAGIDVWYRYPRNSDEPCFPSQFPFHDLPNVVLSPHRGGNGDDTERLRLEALAEVLKGILSGTPVGKASPAQGY